MSFLVCMAGSICHILPMNGRRRWAASVIHVSLIVYATHHAKKLHEVHNFITVGIGVCKHLLDLICHFAAIVPDSQVR